MPPAGWLRHRVTIQKLAGTQNSYGEKVKTWQDVATVWASVEPLRGREYIEAAAKKAEVTHRVRIRYRSGINAGMRVIYGSRVFEIVSPPIDVLEKHREIELMCKEIESG